MKRTISVAFLALALFGASASSSEVAPPTTTGLCQDGRDQGHPCILRISKPRVNTTVATCVPDATTACLLGGRFKVRVSFSSAVAGSGIAELTPIAGPASDGGTNFWFFSASNPEMLVKMINGCALKDPSGQGHFWVFIAATTNVGFQADVEDTQNPDESVQAYINLDGQAAMPVQDTSALRCP